ncbi:MAG: hypothetical protein SFZ24_02320 [Planctomycetota bacterium]|nr:hypothetical protein [Planctomycetota bacterium]
MSGAKLMGWMFLLMGTGAIVAALALQDGVYAGCGGTLAAASIPIFLDTRRSRCARQCRRSSGSDDAAVMIAATTAVTLAASTAASGA